MKMTAAFCLQMFISICRLLSLPPKTLWDLGQNWLDKCEDGRVKEDKDLDKVFLNLFFVGNLF